MQFFPAYRMGTYC